MPWKAVDAPGEIAELDDEHHEDLAQPDGGQRQIEVAQLEHRPPDDEGDDPGDDGADDQARQGGHVQLEREQPGQ